MEKVANVCKRSIVDISLFHAMWLKLNIFALWKQFCTIEIPYRKSYPFESKLSDHKKPYFQPYQNHIETITKSYRNHKKTANDFSKPSDNSQRKTSHPKSRHGIMVPKGLVNYGLFWKHVVMSAMDLNSTG